MARRKAYTARMFRTTTLEFQKRTSDPTYAAQRDVADILALGGEVPIQVGNDIIGGRIGISSGVGRLPKKCALWDACQQLCPYFTDLDNS